ncbi:MAG: gamma-glutamyl-phosphate reductase, partial [Actinomycetota bacterium]
MSNDLLIANLADTARKAARTLVAATYEERQKALLNIADALEARTSEIISANNQDMERGRSSGLNSQLLDRLMLNESRIAGIAGGARKVAAL